MYQPCLEEIRKIYEKLDNHQKNFAQELQDLNCGSMSQNATKQIILRETLFSQKLACS